MILNTHRPPIQTIRQAVSKAAILVVFAAASMAAVEPSGGIIRSLGGVDGHGPKKWEDAFVTGNGRHGMMEMIPAKSPAATWLNPLA